MTTPADLEKTAAVQQAIPRARARLADRQLQAVGEVVDQTPLVDAERTAGEPLRVVYLLALPGPGGGARVCLQHANWLTAAGVDVTVVGHWKRPEWMELNARYVQVPWSVDLGEALPPCDVIVAGYWQQILDAKRAGVAPVVHFEQGDFHLYGDVPDNLAAWVPAAVTAADHTIAVATGAAHALQERYGVVADEIVTPAVGAAFLEAGEDKLAAGGPAPVVDGKYALAVGATEFKRVHDVEAAVDKVRALGHDLKLVWVSQSRQPGAGPDVTVVVSPTQDDLVSLYANAAVLVCASEYESFALPPVEAMATRTPVITTDIPGVAMYARDGENCLQYPVGDVDALARALESVLAEDGTAATRAVAAHETVTSYTPEAITRQLVTFYTQVARRKPAPSGLGDWTFVETEMNFDDDASIALLLPRLESTTACEIQVPVRVEVVPGHAVVRWQRLANRSAGSGAIRVWAPASAPAFLSPARHDRWIEELAAGHAERACAGFVKVHRTAPEATKRTVARWVVLALLECGHTDEARTVVDALRADDRGLSDAYYLTALTALMCGDLSWVEPAYAAASALGPAAHTPEWFDDPAAMLAARVGL